MVDFSTLIQQQQEEEKIKWTQTLADRFNFEKLRMVNRDSDQEIINSSLEPFLDWSQSLLRRIPENWEIYLAQIPNDLKTLLSNISEILEDLQGFDELEMGARGSQLNRLSPRVETVMGRTLNSIKELLFLQMIGDDRNRSTQAVLERINGAEIKLNSTLESAEGHALRLSKMAEASQAATAKIAASGRARVFHNEGESFQTTARVWLGVTTLLTLALIVLAFGFALGWFLEIKDGADAGQIAIHLFGKLLILATVGAAVTFSAKQYGASKHNAIQNFHRSSSLRTYRALLAATNDEAVHEAILQQAAQAIFSPSETGYSKHGAAFDQSPVVQLIQGISKNGSPPTN